MKKTILMVAFAVATLSIIACKTEPKAASTTEIPGEAADDYIETAGFYSCPMDCEKGKIYTAKENCPICEMELVVLNEAVPESHEGHDHDNHEGHSH